MIRSALLTALLLILTLNLDETHGKVALGGRLYFQPYLLTSEPFAWSDCGNGTLPLTFTELSLTPDPISVPGLAKIAFQAKLTKGVAAPVKVVLHMHRKAVIWVPLPCEKGFGSCTYEDICPFLEKIVCDPHDANDVSCHCPFKPGAYTLAPTDVSIDSKLVPFPWIIVRGSYRVHMEIFDKEGKVSCLETQFTLV